MLLLLLAALASAPPPEEPRPAEAVEAIARPHTQALEVPHFRLVYTDRAQGAARALAGELEELRQHVVDVLGRDWPGTTELRLGFGRAEYEALAMGGQRPPSWAVALAWPDENVVLVEAHSLVQGDGQLTLRHELLHAALGQLGRGWPRWFQEGLAQELTMERRYQLSQYATLARAVQLDRVFPFEDLARGFPEDPGDVEIAYAQSAAFVEFLRARYSQAAFGELYDAMGRGAPFEQAFGLAFHSPLSADERDFRSELPGRYPLWPIITGGTTLWALTAVLLVAAWARRRQEIARRREEASRQEALEDAAFELLRSVGAPANDDAEPLGPHQPGWPWLLTITRSRSP